MEGEYANWVCVTRPFIGPNIDSTVGFAYPGPLFHLGRDLDGFCPFLVVIVITYPHPGGNVALVQETSVLIAIRFLIELQIKLVKKTRRKDMDFVTMNGPVYH